MVAEEDAVPVSTFAVKGPVCGTCLAELLDQARSVKGVSRAAACLGAGDTALLVLDGVEHLSASQLREAVERTGFVLAPARTRGRHWAPLLAAISTEVNQNDEIGSRPRSARRRSLRAQRRDERPRQAWLDGEPSVVKIGGHHEETRTLMEEHVSQEEAEKVVDPVCGMSIDQAFAAASTEYEGNTYYFCSNDCAQRFPADAAKYAIGK